MTQEFVVEVPDIILWGARDNTVSKVILVIGLGLNQAERKNNLYNSTIYYLPKCYSISYRLSPVGEGFRRMEELYGLEARLSLYNTNGVSDNHARYESIKITKAFRLIWFLTYFIHKCFSSQFLNIYFANSLQNIVTSFVFKCQRKLLIRLFALSGCIWPWCYCCWQYWARRTEWRRC